MQKYIFRKSPRYESTITWSDCCSWHEAIPAAAPFCPACVFESIRDGKWSLYREYYPNTLFELVLEGSVEYIVEGHAFRSNAGELFLTPPGHHVTVGNPEPAHCRRIGIEFYGKNILSLLSELHIALPQNIRLRDPSLYETLMRKIYEKMKRQRGEEIAGLLGLSWQLITQTSIELNDPDEPIPGNMQQLLDRIHSNPESELSLEKMCRITGTNPSAVNRFFRNRFKMSPKAYLIQRRMERGLFRLQRGESVKEAASAMGFRNPFYFSRVFSRTFGYPPSKVSRS